jgi:methylase of polypeptide subunit release factors
MTTFQFALFDSPLDLAHHFFENLLSQTDHVIDATCGQGFDALKLIKKIPDGYLYAFDIQDEAIKSTQKKLELFKNFSLIKQSHETFPDVIKKGSIKLIVYNLGYLPKTCKTITTKKESTIQSIKNALQLVSQGGVISIMCYPGHEEGLDEMNAVFEFVKKLNKFEYLSSSHQLMNRDRAPCWVLIQKKKEASEKGCC